MRVAAALRTALRLSSERALRRAVGTSSLTLVERLLGPALAYTLLFREPTEGLLVAGALAVVVAARGVAQRGSAARNGAELYERAVKAMLGGDVLRASLLPDEEALGNLFEALHRVALVLAETVPHLAANAVAAAILVLVVVTRETAEVALGAGLALVLGAMVLAVSRRGVARSQEEAWQSWERVAEGVTDACEGRLELVAMGREDEFLHRFRVLSDAWDHQARRAGRIAGLVGRLPVVLLAAAVGAAVLLDARLHAATWSQAGARAALLASTAPAFLGIARALQELASNDPRLRFVARALEQAARRPGGATWREHGPATVELRALQFAYGGEAADALRSVSFLWRPGEVLGLAGPNGSGKSTCVRAILGLGEARAGAVLVDGISLLELDGATWRRTVAFLPQRPYLASRLAVRDCLRFLDPQLSEEAMHGALRKVGMLDRLQRASSDPLAVRVGSLSTGERQRVALARVLCTSAPMVLLDEPDANLDADGVAMVAALIVELARERMVLVVAHTAEVLGVADRVVTLEGGRVRAEVERRTVNALPSR